MNAQFIIETDEHGKTKVFINGIEMSRYIRKIEYIHEGGGLPIVRVDFIPDSISIDSPRKTQLVLPERFVEMVAKEYSAVKTHDAVEN